MSEIINGRYDEPQLAEEEVVANEGAGPDGAADDVGIAVGEWIRPKDAAYHTVDDTLDDVVEGGEEPVEQAHPATAPAAARLSSGRAQSAGGASG